MPGDFRRRWVAVPRSAASSLLTAGEVLHIAVGGAGNDGGLGGGGGSLVVGPGNSPWSSLAAAVVVVASTTLLVPATVAAPSTRVPIGSWSPTSGRAMAKS